LRYPNTPRNGISFVHDRKATTGVSAVRPRRGATKNGNRRGVAEGPPYGNVARIGKGIGEVNARRKRKSKERARKKTAQGRQGANLLSFW